MQVGPLGVGVGPRFDNGYYGRRGYYNGYGYGRGYGYDRGRGYVAYGYGDNCRMIRARVVRNGYVTYGTRRVCN